MNKTAVANIYICSMTTDDFLPKQYTHTLTPSAIKVMAPSNIALIKYWGKHKAQLPKNPSISFTLNNCTTTTQLHFSDRKASGTDFDFEVLLNGKPAPAFAPKIKQFFERIKEYVPFIKDFNFRIETSNNFPHSSGIASSASGMSALALCVMEMERQLRPEISIDYTKLKASFMSRLGSGSACRSIEGPIVVWGKHKDIKNSSDLYGIECEDILNPVFQHYQDTILLVDEGEKQVSSTLGHNLMKHHTYAASRFEQAYVRITELLTIFKEGDLEGFIHLVESEALTLHAMMMTSSPYFILMKPNTLKIINALWDYRRQSNIPVCFTLDAGANVHVLYPKENKDAVLQFIRDELVIYCQRGQYICDEMGMGAKIIH